VALRHANIPEAQIEAVTATLAREIRRATALN
jgi:hypothetical protein